MVDVALWRTVGRLLQRERRRRGWTLRDVMRRGGPNFATVQAHERGQIRTMAALSAHLAVFRWRLFDVVLLVAKLHPVAASPELLALTTAYGEATIAGRSALLTVATLLPPMRRHTKSRRRSGTAGGANYSGEIPGSTGVRRN